MVGVWGLLVWGLLVGGCWFGGGEGFVRDLVVGGVFSGWNRINLLIGGLVFWLWVDFLG